MKRRTLALALAVVMTVSLLSVGASAAKTSLFADVKTTDWFYNAVDYVNSNGLMTGTGTGFAPNDATTRAQIWTILARLNGENYDRNTSDWYAGYQTWAIRNSISDGTDPNGQITREQLATMLYRYAIRMGFVSNGSWADLSVYPDANDVSAFALEAMQWAVGCGLIQGMDGKLNPQGTATRAQVATILWRMRETWALLPEKDLSGILGALQPTYQQHVHQYTYTGNGNFTHTGSCDCGETVTEGCTYVTTTIDTGTQYICSVCGDYYIVGTNNDGQTIDPVARIGDKAYETLAKAVSSATSGDTIVLMTDVNLPDKDYRINGKSITIDLNGCTVTGKGYNGVFNASGSAELTLNDSKGGGGVIAKEKKVLSAYAMAVCVAGSNAKIIINGGSYSQQLTTANPTQFDLIYAQKGTIEINGGSFACATSKWTLNCENENYAAGVAKIIVKGGSFAKFNPAADDAGDDGSFVPAGYTSVQNGEDYTVRKLTASDEVEAKVDGTYYATLDEALNVAESGTTVTMTESVTADATATSSTGYGEIGKSGVAVEGKTLDGSGSTLTVTNANGSWDHAINTNGGTIKNLTVKGAFRGIFTGGLASDLYVESVIIDDVTYTFSADGSGDYNVSFKNSTLNGWTSYTSGFKSIGFTNCSFGSARGYAYCRPYSNTTFTGCTFASGYKFDATQATSTFVNCYVGSTLITSENVTALLGADAASVVINNS